MQTADHGVTAPLKPTLSPAYSPVREAEAVNSSVFPTYRETKMEWIWSESLRFAPLMPEGGSGGFKWLVHKILVLVNSLTHGCL